VSGTNNNIKTNLLSADSIDLCYQTSLSKW